MFPNVYATLRANATVVSIVGTKIGRHGSMPQGTVAPYIAWFLVVDDPYEGLSDPPDADFTTIQIDCYAGPADAADSQIQQLAEAVRAALDAAGVHNRVIVDLREPDTKLYRVGIQADFITQRT